MSLPRRWFKYTAFPYRERPWEKGGKVYERLGIRKWKTKLPDMSRIIKKMTPKKINTRPTAEHTWLLVAETCVAESVHSVLILFGWGCAFIWQGAGGITVSTLYVIGNVPFILIQRYNRPRQAALAASLELKEKSGGSYESA